MPETGFLDRTLQLAGRHYRYQVYVPAGYSAPAGNPHPAGYPRPAGSAPAHGWPIILFLHGAGECGVDGLRPTDVGLGPAIRRRPDRFPAIVVFPQAPPESDGWRGDAAAAAMRALDRTVAEFQGDPRRLYLTGLSMGGSGTIRLAALYPDRFAALASVCPDFSGEPADAPLALARKIRPVPIWVFQGEDDEAPTPAATRRLVRELQRHSPEVRYTEYPRTGHNAWERAYAEPTLVPWLLARRR